MSKIRPLFIAAAVFCCTIGQSANAQSSEERFQDIFITAGYATAFGAALGAASLSFFEDPQEHLQFVAIGASLGFIGGSVLGSYMVFSPMVASEQSNPMHSTLLADASSAETGTVVIRPTINPKKHSLSQIEGAWTLMRF